MTTLKVMLNTSRILKNGKYPVVFRLIHRRKKKLIYTPFYLEENEFDATAQKAVTHSRLKIEKETVDRINSYLRKESRALNCAIESVCFGNPHAQVEDIVCTYRQNANLQYVKTYFMHVISVLKQAGRQGSAYVYSVTLNHLLRYTCSDTLTFSAIDTAFIENFRNHMRTCVSQGGRRLTENSINLYLRILGAVYNLALQSGIDGGNENPFLRLSFPNQKTKTREVESDVIRQVQEMSSDGDAAMELAKDCFMFSYFACGIPFVDMVFLRPANVADGVLRYERHKTCQPVHVVILPPVQEIIDKYKGGTYLLPLLREIPGKDSYTGYRLALKRYNRQLKRIEKKLKLSVHLSSYVPRHTWATEAYNKGIAVSIISRSLGHATERPTYSYIGKMNQEVLHQANLKVLGLESEIKM